MLTRAQRRVVVKLRFPIMIVILFFAVNYYFHPSDGTHKQRPRAASKSVVGSSHDPIEPWSAAEPNEGKQFSAGAMPHIGNVQFIRQTDQTVTLRVEGPADDQDDQQLAKLSPLKEGVYHAAVDVPQALRASQMAERSNWARAAHVATSNIQLAIEAVELSKGSAVTFRFVLVVLAVRTRKPLNVFDTVLKWQQQCDFVTRGAVNEAKRSFTGDGTPNGNTFNKNNNGRKTTYSNDKRSTPPSTVVCLFSVVFPSEYLVDAVEHYRHLFEIDDTILVTQSDVSLTHGIGKLQQAGYDAGALHFSKHLGTKADIGYILLTSAQFTPIISSRQIVNRNPLMDETDIVGGGVEERVSQAMKSTSMFVKDLVKQYDSTIESLPSKKDGSVPHGTILGCTLAIDETVEELDGSDTQLVVDHGGLFLMGNGNGGTLLNSIYGVRRHAGVSLRDERMRGSVVNVDAVHRPLEEMSGVNVSSLPRGLDAVHFVSPYCAMVGEPLFRSLQGVSGTYVDPLSEAKTVPLDPATDARITVQSAIEDYEDAIGTGIFKPKDPQRSIIQSFARIQSRDDKSGEESSEGQRSDPLAELINVTTVRLQRLDSIRSGIRFAEVMSGTPQFKRTVSFLIRFVDECTKFFDSVASSRGVAHFAPRAKSSSAFFLTTLSPVSREVERRHAKLIDGMNSTLDKIAAASLYASRAMDALARAHHFAQKKVHTSAEYSMPEESALWDLCLRARSRGVVTVVSNLAVRFRQRQYLESVLMADMEEIQVDGGPVLGQITAHESPVFRAFTSGHRLLPTSTRLAGPFEGRWGDAIRSSLFVHPSFQQKPRMQVVWYTHCCHCCGFTNELQSLVYPLQHHVNVHLTAELECFCGNATRTLQDTLLRLHSLPSNIKRYDPDDIVVYISHTNPTLFHLHREVSNAPHDYLVGRSMYEFSRINSEHIKIANEMADEIWVPAQFVYHSYLSSGCKKEKLVIIPEAIDTHVFDPASALRYTLPPVNTFFHQCNRPLSSTAKMFNFLSDFKWEPRKGWDVLFEAYFRSFNDTDDVVLYVMTHIWFPGGPETYGWAHNVTWIIEDLYKYIEHNTSVLKDGLSREHFPNFCIISDPMSVQQIAGLYNSVDAFVYTTRGEGWGLPAMQAMSMGLPVIATNFGGVTEFMKPFNSFLVELDAVEEIPFDSVYGWSFGTKWALPSKKHVSRLLRYVKEHPDHGKRVGAVARKYIVEKFSEEALGQILDARLQLIREKVLAKRLLASIGKKAAN